MILRSLKWDPKTGPPKICVGDIFWMRGGPFRKKGSNDVFSLFSSSPPKHIDYSYLRTPTGWLLRTKYPSILSLLTTDLDPFEWLAMSATASKRLHRRQGRGGARTMTQIIQFLIRSVTKDVEEDPTSSSVVHLPFATGHVPLGQMMPPPPLQIISAAAARGKGARWGFFLPLNLFWICRNGRAGCKSNSILQCSNYACKSRCWESESDFWPWVNSRNHAEFPFLFGFKQFKMTPKWIMNDTNSTDVDLWRQLSQ